MSWWSFLVLLSLLLLHHHHCRCRHSHQLVVSLSHGDSPLHPHRWLAHSAFCFRAQLLTRPLMLWQQMMTMKLLLQLLLLLEQLVQVALAMHRKMALVQQLALVLWILPQWSSLCHFRFNFQCRHPLCRFDCCLLCLSLCPSHFLLHSLPLCHLICASCWHSSSLNQLR